MERVTVKTTNADEEIGFMDISETDFHTMIGILNKIRDHFIIASDNMAHATGEKNFFFEKYLHNTCFLVEILGVRTPVSLGI